VQRATPATPEALSGKLTPSVAPPPASVGQPNPAAAAAPPRHVARFEVEAKLETGAVQKLQCQDVSRAGCFLLSSAPPPRVFSRLSVTLPGVGALQGDVVRLVSAEQAQAWNMPQGFGVQFVGVKPEQRESLDRLTHGLPVAPTEPKPVATPADDTVAEKVLGDLRRRIQGDHYVVMAVPHDADVATVRAKGRDLARQLVELKKRPLSPAQEKQVDAAMTRIREAVDVLGVPPRRAEFDGLRFNWKGVAQCLAAGLRVPDLEAARSLFLKANAGADARSRLHLITATSYEKDRNYQDALKSVELALSADPLLLELHHKRNALLKLLGQR
jgi:serine/threonine-protein kinase